MSEHRPENSPAAQSRLSRVLHVNVWRAITAAVLLAGLFALLFFVLLPSGGGDDSVLPGRMVMTPIESTGLDPGVRTGSLARDFEATNLSGARFRLSDLRGRPLVINFWATWCASCLAEMPVLEEQRQLHKADDFAVLGVNVGEGRDSAAGFIDALELFDFAVAMDPDLTISDAYGIRGLPHSVFIDRNGVVQATYQGQLDDGTMQRYVEAAIEAVPGGEPEFYLRFVNPVPREHVLQVLPSDEPGRVVFASRRFRCDDAYCGDPAIDALRDLPGVKVLNLNRNTVPPEMDVTFDVALIGRDQVVGALADALRDLPDPLYTLELQVRFLG